MINSVLSFFRPSRRNQSSSSFTHAKKTPLLLEQTEETKCSYDYHPFYNEFQFNGDEGEDCCFVQGLVVGKDEESRENNCVLVLPNNSNDDENDSNDDSSCSTISSCLSNLSECRDDSDNAVNLDRHLVTPDPTNTPLRSPIFVPRNIYETPDGLKPRSTIDELRARLLNTTISDGMKILDDNEDDCKNSRAVTPSNNKKNTQSSHILSENDRFPLSTPSPSPLAPPANVLRLHSYHNPKTQPWVPEDNHKKHHIGSEQVQQHTGIPLQSSITSFKNNSISSGQKELHCIRNNNALTPTMTTSPMLREVHTGNSCRTVVGALVAKVTATNGADDIDCNIHTNSSVYDNCDYAGNRLSHRGGILAPNTLRVIDDMNSPLKPFKLSSPHSSSRQLHSYPIMPNPTSLSSSFNNSNTETSSSSLSIYSYSFSGSNNSKITTSPQHESHCGRNSDLSHSLQHSALVEEHRKYALLLTPTEKVKTVPLQNDNWKDNEKDMTMRNMNPSESFHTSKDLSSVLPLNYWMNSEQEQQDTSMMSHLNQSFQKKPNQNLLPFTPVSSSSFLLQPPSHNNESNNNITTYNNESQDFCRYQQGSSYSSVERSTVNEISATSSCVNKTCAGEGKLANIMSSSNQKKGHPNVNNTSVVSFSSTTTTTATTTTTTSLSSSLSLSLCSMLHNSRQQQQQNISSDTKDLHHMTSGAITNLLSPISTSTAGGSTWEYYQDYKDRESTMSSDADDREDNISDHPSRDKDSNYIPASCLQNIHDKIPLPSSNSNNEMNKEDTNKKRSVLFGQHESSKNNSSLLTTNNKNLSKVQQDCTNDELNEKELTTELNNLSFNSRHELLRFCDFYPPSSPSTSSRSSSFDLDLDQNYQPSQLPAVLSGPLSPSRSEFKNENVPPLFCGSEDIIANDSNIDKKKYDNMPGHQKKSNRRTNSYDFSNIGNMSGTNTNARFPLTPIHKSTHFKHDIERPLHLQNLDTMFDLPNVKNVTKQQGRNNSDGIATDTVIVTKRNISNDMIGSSTANNITYCSSNGDTTMSSLTSPSLNSCSISNSTYQYPHSSQKKPLRSRKNPMSPPSVASSSSSSLNLHELPELNENVFDDSSCSSSLSSFNRKARKNSLHAAIGQKLPSFSTLTNSSSKRRKRENVLKDLIHQVLDNAFLIKQIEQLHHHMDQQYLSSASLSSSFSNCDNNVATTLLSSTATRTKSFEECQSLDESDKENTQLPHNHSFKKSDSVTKKTLNERNSNSTKSISSTPSSSSSSLQWPGGSIHYLMCLMSCKSDISKKTENDIDSVDSCRSNAIHDNRAAAIYRLEAILQELKSSSISREMDETNKDLTRALRFVIKLFTSCESSYTMNKQKTRKWEINSDKWNKISATQKQTCHSACAKKNTKQHLTASQSAKSIAPDIVLRRSVEIIASLLEKLAHAMEQIMGVSSIIAESSSKVNNTTPFSLIVMSSSASPLPYHQRKKMNSFHHTALKTTHFRDKLPVTKALEEIKRFYLQLMALNMKNMSDLHFCFDLI